MISRSCRVLCALSDCMLGGAEDGTTLCEMLMGI